MGYSLLRDSYPIARKIHRCIWCGEAIEPGEKYWSEQSIYYGNFQHHKWHLECESTSKDYFAEGDNEFIPYENERPSVCILDIIKAEMKP